MTYIRLFNSLGKFMYQMSKISKPQRTMEERRKTKVAIERVKSRRVKSTVRQPYLILEKEVKRSNKRDKKA